MVATAQPRTPGHASSQGSGELLHFGLLKLRVCVPAASQRKDLTTMFFGRKKRNGFFFSLEEHKISYKTWVFNQAKVF